MRILLLDIENAPNLAHVWKIWDENIQLDRLLEPKYILCWAAKWYGKDKIYFSSLHDASKEVMLRRIHMLLDEADVVVHYNGKRHDIPMLNKEFVELGMNPPSPYKQIDLLTTVKNRFQFTSNKLAYVAKELGLGEKIPHEGHPLWIKCMEGDAEAWKSMREYNVNDVILLEALYTKVRPWVTNHPNVSIVEQDALSCIGCGSFNYSKRGVAITKDRKYQRYQCNKCGSWFRSTISKGPKQGEKFSGIPS